MKKTLKGLTALTVLFLFTGGVSAFNVSLVDDSGALSNLEYDKTTPDGFFQGFPEGFERSEEIGSNSFTDNSLVSPNILISYESDQDLTGEELEIYYKSFSGDLERPVSTRPVELNGLNGEKEIEVSAFEALYPGKLYASTSSETAEIEGGRLNGSYLVSTEASQRTSTTSITVEEAFDSDGSQIHEGRSFSEDLLVSVVQDGSAVAEREMALYGTEEFETVLDGNETIYVNNLSALETRKASPCTTLDASNSYYVLDSSVFNADPEGENGGDESCLKINGEDITVDFADNLIDGDANFSNKEACGVKIEDSSRIQVDNLNVQQFSRGLCIQNSTEVTVSGKSIQENRKGTYSNDSEASLTDITSSNMFEEYTGVSKSYVDMSNFSFESAQASVSGYNISVDNATLSTSPEGLESTGDILDITGNDPSSLENLTYFFAEEPDVIYSPSQETELNSEKNNNSIFLTESLTPPSLVGTFIESEGQDEGPGGGSGGGGGGGSGGGGGGGGGGLPGLLPGNETDENNTGNESLPGNLAPEQVPTVKISANDSFSVQQGTSFELPFQINSTGNVSAVDITVNVSTPQGWRSTNAFFDEILPGEASDGRLFVDVFEAELLRSYQLRLEASTEINDTFVSLDNETVEVVIEPREDVRDIKVLEGPFRLNIAEGTARTESFELRNSGDYRLENVSIRPVGLQRCLDDVYGAWSFDEEVEERFNYTFEASESIGSCDGSLIFYSESSELLGIVPARINVLEKIDDFTDYLLPWLVLIWTLFTMHRVWRWKNERRE